jgi:hypothetical protein
MIAKNAEEIVLAHITMGLLSQGFPEVTEILHFVILCRIRTG